MSVTVQSLNSGIQDAKQMNFKIGLEDSQGLKMK